MAALGDLPPDTKASVHFSAKEAAFKAMSSRGSAVSLRDIEIACRPEAATQGTFVADSAGEVSASGYYAIGQGMVLTLCTLSDTAFPGGLTTAPQLSLAAAQ